MLQNTTDDLNAASGQVNMPFLSLGPRSKAIPNKRNPTGPAPRLTARPAALQRMGKHSAALKTAQGLSVSVLRSSFPIAAHSGATSITAARREPGSRGAAKGQLRTRRDWDSVIKGLQLPHACWQQSTGCRAAALFYLITDYLGFLSRDHQSKLSGLLNISVRYLACCVPNG